MAEPRLRFLIGGVQKGGTTALAEYLAAHAAIQLPARKEAHVFDAPDFDDGWSVADIDRRFDEALGPSREGVLCGDATPITVFHPTLVARVARYNPGMRWIVLLRDPVDRAISHYFMERARGNEPFGLLRAVLAERRRCRGHEDDWSFGSPLRTWTYAARGRYAAQLRTLHAAFPSDQLLLLRSRDLAADPAATVARALAFLGLPPMPVDAAFPRVFEGRYAPPPPWSPGRLALRWILRHERARLRDGFGVDLGRP